MTPPTFDWRDRSHWSERARRCCRCGRFTQLVDDDGHPSHKTCAEAEAAA